MPVLICSIPSTYNQLATNLRLTYNQLATKQLKSEIFEEVIILKRSYNQPIEQLSFTDREEKWGMGKKLFDYVIGNPPYQDEAVGEQKSFAPPVYDKFMEEAYKVADRVELIHPARFLFNAGGTPKAWNEKMLADPHFKILSHE